MGIKQSNLDLARLVANLLRQNWGATLNMVSAVGDAQDVPAQRERLLALMQLSRIRGNAAIPVGNFADVVDDSPADLNIFGLQPEVDFDACRSLMRTGRASAVFVQGSGTENALA